MNEEGEKVGRPLRLLVWVLPKMGYYQLKAIIWAGWGGRVETQRLTILSSRVFHLPKNCLMTI